jgi:hypothetical protein
MSISFIAMFVYFNFYMGYISGFRAQFFVRVIST